MQYVKPFAFNNLFRNGLVTVENSCRFYLPVIAYEIWAQEELASVNIAARELETLSTLSCENNKLQFFMYLNRLSTSQHIFLIWYPRPPFHLRLQRSSYRNVATILSKTFRKIFLQKNCIKCEPHCSNYSKRRRVISQMKKRPKAAQ